MWWMLGNRASGAKLVSLVKGLEFPHLGIGWLVLGKRMTYGDKKSRRGGIACDIPFLRRPLALDWRKAYFKH